MSLILLRKIVPRLQNHLNHSATRNLCFLRQITSLSSQNSNVLIAKQVFKAIKQINRYETSITIKQYQSSRKYTTLWKMERLAGLLLFFLIPLAFYIESKEIEVALGLTATMHTYWGCQSMCNDYVRSAVVGKVLPVLVRVINVSLVFATFAGLYQLIYNDCGIINMVKKFWAIRGKDYRMSKE